MGRRAFIRIMGSIILLPLLASCVLFGGAQTAQDLRGPSGEPADPLVEEAEGTTGEATVVSQTDAIMQEGSDEPEQEVVDDGQFFAYSEPERWLSLPQEVQKEVDLFYLYPADFQVDLPVVAEDKQAAELFIESDTVETEKATRISEEKRAHYYLVSQAGAFSASCNIFSPYYEPLDPFPLLPKSKAEQERVLSSQLLPQITDAFAYYIKSLSDGRPFILAGHGQGSALLLLVLKNYLPEHPELKERMIAAYLPGISVTDEDLEGLDGIRFATGADDLHVVISWNTEGENIQDENPVVTEDALVINPMNWSQEPVFVSRLKNRGAVFFDAQGEEIITIDRFTSSELDPQRRVIVVYEPDTTFYRIGNSNQIPLGVFHLQDYTFFYKNIAENARRRIAAYQGSR